MNLKEQYWKYSLIVIILFMGVIIFRQITPFLGGLLGAFTIYILVRTQMHHLTEKKKMKRSISALLITAETIFVFLVPLGLTIWMIVNKLQDINLAPQTFHPASSRIYQRKDRIRCIREGYVVVHSLHPSTNRTTDYVKYQQSRRQSVRHDICSLLHADRR